MDDPYDQLTVAIRATDFDSLFELVRTKPLDYGCRPLVTRADDDALETVAHVSSIELEDLRASGYDVVVLRDEHAADRSGTIGEGDRFDGGNRAPQGLGTDPEQDPGKILNADEIDSAITGLVNEYGIPTFGTPNPTAEGSGGGGGLVGGANPDDYHVYFTAGVHARERGGPDCLIYFIADLLHAQRHGVGIQYGGRSYANAAVLRALGTGIVFFPLVNPDGVRWDQQTGANWRKNRNPVSAIPGVDTSIGVDINRNYDFLWDYRRHFHSSAHADSLASDSPASYQFHGRSPFSEPETRNVAWVFDTFPRIRWYMDIHSHAGSVLYSWGDDVNQSGDPAQSFLNPAHDGQRGILSALDYREWIEEAEHGRVAEVAGRVTGAMSGVGGRSFFPQQSVGLFPTSGASDDYAFSRGQADPNRNKVYGFTMEFGPRPHVFYPTLPEYRNDLLDVGAGLMELCLAAADVGLT